MTYKGIETALREAERFCTGARAAMLRLKIEGVLDSTSLTGRKEISACRRASLDLTRALAEMRRPR